MSKIFFKKTLDENIGRLDNAEENVNELEGIALKTN